MNKQMTVEEINDAKAYPAKAYRKTISESAMVEAMRELAKLESGKLPGSRYGRPTNKPKRSDVRDGRIIAALKAGPMTRKQLAFTLGVTHQTAGDYLRPLLKAGRVVSVGMQQKNELFALPDCPRIKRQHIAGDQYAYSVKEAQ